MIKEVYVPIDFKRIAAWLAIKEKNRWKRQKQRWPFHYE